MLISYNSDQLVKDRFKDWNCAEFDLTYTMRSVGEYMRNQKTEKSCFSSTTIQEFFKWKIDHQICIRT